MLKKCYDLIMETTRKDNSMTYPTTAKNAYGDTLYEKTFETLTEAEDFASNIFEEDDQVEKVDIEHNDNTEWAWSTFDRPN